MYHQIQEVVTNLKPHVPALPRPGLAGSCMATPKSGPSPSTLRERGLWYMGVDVGRLRRTGAGDVTFGQSWCATWRRQDLLIPRVDYDHVVNWTLVPHAHVWVGGVQLEWAPGRGAEWGFVPELSVDGLVRSASLPVMGDGDEVMPGVRGLLTPGHLEVVLTSGDAVKNQAELLERRPSSADDGTTWRVSCDRIWQRLSEYPRSILIPGHDVPSRVGRDGVTGVHAEREASIGVWLRTKLDDLTREASGKAAKQLKGALE